MKSKKQKKRPIILFLDIIICFLCIGLILAVSFMIRSFQETYYSYSEDSFYYRLVDGDYASMVTMYYENKANDREEDENLEEYYGVAKYFEAASYYKIYNEIGDTVRANFQREKMQAALEEMGDLAGEEQRIKEKLDISE